MWLPFAAAVAGTDQPLPMTSSVAPSPAPVADVAPATLSFDCKVPAEIVVDGHTLGQLWFTGVVSWKVAPGRHVVQVYVSGAPNERTVELQPNDAVTVLVGRTGVSVSDPTPSASRPSGPARVGFRVVGGGSVELRLDGQRTLVAPGVEHVVELAAGAHPLVLRSAEGTAIWSSGSLEVTGGAVVVQLSEGRLPEVSGGAVFHPGG